MYTKRLSHGSHGSWGTLKILSYVFFQVQTCHSDLFWFWMAGNTSHQICHPIFQVHEIWNWCVHAFSPCNFYTTSVSEPTLTLLKYLPPPPPSSSQCQLHAVSVVNPIPDVNPPLPPPAVNHMQVWCQSPPPPPPPVSGQSYSSQMSTPPPPPPPPSVVNSTPDVSPPLPPAVSPTPVWCQSSPSSTAVIGQSYCCQISSLPSLPPVSSLRMPIFFQCCQHLAGKRD